MSRASRFLAALLCATLLCGAPAPVYTYKVIHVYPHDPTSYTQGLEYRGGYLYEGTGLNGRSKLRKIELATGKVLQETRVPDEYFGEGITVLNQQIVQLTWQSQRGFIYEQPTMKLLRNFQYPGEGWGLTNDGKRLYMSDGTAQIRCWNPATLQEEKRLNVHDGQREVVALNELEFIKGEIYANVYQTDRIARVSPTDGRVVGWVDLSGILPPADRQGVDVLNGIAYDSFGDRLFVTGKLWPKLFEIKVVPKPAAPAAR